MWRRVEKKDVMEGASRPDRPGQFCKLCCIIETSEPQLPQLKNEDSDVYLKAVMK